MLNLIYFVLICFGMTTILIDGKIFDSIRPKHKFFKCPLCMSFWVGLCVWKLSYLSELIVFGQDWTTGLMLGCLSSGTTYLLYVSFDDDGVKINVKK